MSDRSKMQRRLLLVFYLILLLWGGMHGTHLSLTLLHLHHLSLVNDCKPAQHAEKLQNSRGGGGRGCTPYTRGREYTSTSLLYNFTGAVSQDFRQWSPSTSSYPPFLLSSLLQICSENLQRHWPKSWNFESAAFKLPFSWKLWSCS
jgi:hypothetical protein